VRSIKEKISVIIPAHNEISWIISTLEETVKTFDQFGCSYEIIVMDDGSTDGTYEKVLEFSHRHTNVFVKKNLKNYGKGRAIKKGYRYTSGNYVVFLDADMELHPAQLQTFIDIMRLDNADVVIGSKMHTNSIVNYAWHRKIVSRVYFFLVKILFGLPIHDTQTGLKLFKTEVLKRVLPKIVAKQFAYDLEVLANVHRLGYKIAEAPVVLDQQKRYGRIGIKAIYQTFFDTLAIFYRVYILRYYDKIDRDSEE